MPHPEPTGGAPKKSEACAHNREGGQDSAIPGGVAASQADAGFLLEELTPEEQLARYEESLKNDDWGHQPC